MTQCMPASMAWRELSDLRQAKQSMRHSSNSSDSSTVLSSTMLSRASSQGCSPAQHRPASDSPVLELPLPLAGAPAPAGPSEGGGHQLMHIRRSSSLDAGLKPLAPVPASPVSASSAPLASQCPIATSSIVEVSTGFWCRLWTAALVCGCARCMCSRLQAASRCRQLCSRRVTVTADTSTGTKPMPVPACCAAVVVPVCADAAAAGAALAGPVPAAGPGLLCAGAAAAAPHWQGGVRHRLFWNVAGQPSGLQGAG